MKMGKIVKVIDYLLVGSIGLTLLILKAEVRPLSIPSLNLVLPGPFQFILFAVILLLLRIGLSLDKSRYGLLSFAQFLRKHRIIKILSQKDILFISLSRPLLLIFYFFTEGFFLYVWDDQEGYFEVAQGLAKFDPIVERFTLGFPAILVPFIKLFPSWGYAEIHVLFSIINGFILGTLSIYLLFRITKFLTGNNNVARVAALIYAVHPFLPFFAKAERSWYLRTQIAFGNITGWNMTSDHVCTVFLLLAVFLFLRNLEKGRSLFLPGIAVGYVGLIRMPNLVILLPLCYLALIKRQKIQNYLLFFFGVFLGLSPQLAYNWHFFRNPFHFGYTAIPGHVSEFWTFDIFIQGHTLAAIIMDHYMLLVFCFLALFLRPNRKTGVFVLLWIYPLAGYYAGYQHFYNDPVRFLHALRPALCIGIGLLITFGKNSLERFFFCGSLLTLFLISSYNNQLLIPFGTLPSALITVCIIFTLIGMYLGITFSTIIPIYVYSVFYVYLARIGFSSILLFSTLCLLLNMTNIAWGSLFHRVSVYIQPVWRKILDAGKMGRSMFLRFSTAHRKLCILFLCPAVCGTIAVYLFQTTWGLNAQYYANADWEGKPAISRIDRTPCVQEGREGENILSVSVFSVKWTGWITIDQTGTHKFATNSDDGSYLRIDGKTVVDNGGAHGSKKVSGEISLNQGVYPIEILYFQTGGWNIIQTFWTPPGKSEQLIPSKILFSERPGWLHRLFRKSMPVPFIILTLLWAGVLLFIGMTSLPRFSKISKTYLPLLNRVKSWFITQGLALLCFKSYRKQSILVLSLLISGSIGVLLSQGSWGLQGFYYSNTNWEGEPAISILDKKPRLRGEIGYHDFPATNYSVKWTGWIAIDEPGTYRFATNSDDGSYLRINGQLVVNNGGTHGLKKLAGQINLETGAYSIEVLYVQEGGESVLYTLWTPPGQSERFIPPEVFFPEQPDHKAMMIRKGMAILLKIVKIIWGSLFLFVSLMVLIAPVKITNTCIPV